MGDEDLADPAEGRDDDGPAKSTPVPDSNEDDDFGLSAGSCDSTSLMVDLRPAFPMPHRSVGHATG